MSLSFTIKRGDTSPAIIYALSPETVDLTGATVVLQIQIAGVTADKAATVVTETGTPTVSYSWQTGDTNTPGIHPAEWRVTFANGKIETFPNKGFIMIEIEPDI